MPNHQAAVALQWAAVHAFECSQHHLLSPRPPPLPPGIGRQNLCAGRGGIGGEGGMGGRKGTPGDDQIWGLRWATGLQTLRLKKYKTFYTRKIKSVPEFNLLRHWMTHLNGRRSALLSTNASHPAWTSWLLCRSCIISKIWQKIPTKIFSSGRSICQGKATHITTNSAMSICCINF